MANAADGVLVVDNSDHRRAGSWFENCLAGCAAAVVVTRDEVDPAEAPSWRAVILSGSERSVFEDNDWLDKELIFVRRLLDEGVPVLGVCFGHQLMFRALYGKDVLTRRAAPEVGWLPVTLGRHPVFEGVEETIRPYNFHFDEVAEVPAGWEVVASSEACRLHALRHEELPALGLQFHPEVAPDDGVAGIMRGAPVLAGYGLDAPAIAAGVPRGSFYPEIIRNFVAFYGLDRGSKSLDVCA